MAHISDKYRAITLVSSVLKLLDYIIIEHQSHVFQTDALQFGFKAKSSTTLCTSMVAETVRQFNAGKSNVYAVLLDATKAFDRVEFTKLFGLLLDRGMDALFVRCLLNMYLNQKLRIRWNNCFSETFSVKNGVKQGG